MRERTWKEFALYSIISFTLFIFFTAFITLSYTEETLTAVFFERTFTSLPLIIYLLFFSLITSFLLLSLLRLYERGKEKKVEDALKMLNSGQYSARIFLSMFSEDTPVQVNEVIDKDCLK